MTTAGAIINSAMWISVGAAVIVSILVTGRTSGLWSFVIPFLAGFVPGTGAAKDEGKDGDPQ
jgi:hypothetical protein